MYVPVAVENGGVCVPLDHVCFLVWCGACGVGPVCVFVCVFVCGFVCEWVRVCVIVAVIASVRLCVSDFKLCLLSWGVFLCVFVCVCVVVQ